MSHTNWKSEIFTVPNLLSLFRLVLIPVYLKLYLTADRDSDYILSGAILAVSCLTDLADGIIARAFHMTSRVGMVLDPLADKLTQFFLLISLAVRYRILFPVTALFAFKELFQLGTMIFFAKNGKALPGALLAGKVCTTALFISLTAMVIFPEMDSTAVFVLISLDTTLLIYAFYNYYLAYFGKNTKLTDLDTE